jgi:hypothetical protein
VSWPEAVLERMGFDPSRKKGGNWVRACPVHDDHDPSLTAWLPPGGARLVVKCWTGCDTREVMKVLGVRMGQLKLAVYERDQAYGVKDVVRTRPRVLVNTFDYADEAGVVLYSVNRYEPKDFKQWHRGPGGRLVWGLPEGRRVLYRTWDLARRVRDCVWVVEGERKADLLERVGLLGVCGVGGTGMGWLDEYARQLAGRSVAVVPDNDAAGYKHAERVLGSLIRWGAASVRLAELPGLPERGDVMDLARQRGEDAVRPALCRAGVTWRADR